MPSSLLAANATAAHRRVGRLASNPAVHRAFGWLHLHELQLRRWQLEFLPIGAPPFGEDARAAWFLQRFQELGLENCCIDAEGNVIGQRRGSKVEPGTPVVLVSAHLDTVFPPGTDCTPRESDARLECPGACDNGAGLAALLGLAASFQASGLTPEATVVFAANTGEEGEGNLRGMRALCTRSPFAGRLGAVIALEGAGTGTVVDRALGGRRLRVSLRGPGGHSWADAGLPNPVIALARGLVSIASLPLPENPRTTLNCGTIRGGTSVNSIPELASADLDLRSVSALELDRLELAVLQRLSQVVTQANEGFDEEQRLVLHAERIGDRPAAVLATGSALLGSLRAVDRHLQIQTDSRIGSTDANLPLSLGIPALAMGAGGSGGGVHTLREWYDPTGRELALRRILLLVLDTASLCAAAVAPRP